MKVVAGAVKIGRHRRYEIAAMLAAVGLTKLMPAILATAYASLVDSKGPVSSAVRDRLGASRDRCTTSRRTEVFSTPVRLRSMDDVRFNEQIVVEEIGWEGIVGVHPPTRPAVRKTIRGRCDAIQFRLDWRLNPDSAARIEQQNARFALEPAHHGAAHHAC